MTETNIKAGQAVINKLVLYSFDRKRQVDLNPIQTSLMIVEDIFRSHFYGEMSIVDQENLYEQFPLLGEEWLEIEFYTPHRGTDYKRTYKAFVYAVTDYTVNYNTTSAIYKLKFFSADAFTNATKFRSRYFTGTVSSIVEKVLKDSDYLETKKKVTVQETLGDIEYTSPKITCFEIIEYLRHRAISNKPEDTNNFFFYETHKEYLFRSQAQMIEDAIAKVQANDVTNITNNIYYSDFSHMNDYDVVENKTRTIQDINFFRSYDTYDDLAQGQFNQTTYVYDFNKRDYSNHSFKLLDEFEKTKHFNDIRARTSNLRHSKEFLESIKEETRYNFIFASSLMNDFDDYSGKYSGKATYAQSLAKGSIVARIYGDPVIMIGDALNLVLPTVESTNERQLSRYKSGYYLVGRQLHNFTNGEYIMTLHLYQDSFKLPIQPDEGFNNDTK